MVQKQTILVPSDRSGVWLVRVIHTYSKLSKFINPNQFGKVSIVATNSQAFLQKKKKKKFLFTRPGFTSRRLCGLTFYTYRSNVLLKKRLTPLGRRVQGFASAAVVRKKALSSFIKIL